MQLDYFKIIIASLLIAIPLHYLILGLRKTKYEKGLEKIFSEICCYHLDWWLHYSAPVIRHTLYDNFVIINGKGENERIEYKNIVNVSVSPIHRFSFYYLKYSIEYDYLSIKEKERRSVRISTRYPERVLAVLKDKGVDIDSNI